MNPRVRDNEKYRVKTIVLKSFMVVVQGDYMQCLNRSQISMGMYQLCMYDQIPHWFCFNLVLTLGVKFDVKE